MWRGICPHDLKTPYGTRPDMKQLFRRRMSEIEINSFIFGHLSAVAHSKCIAHTRLTPCSDGMLSLSFQDDSSIFVICRQSILRTTRCSALTKIESQIRHAYLVTLVGIILATITTVYTAVRSFIVIQRLESYRSGNFTGTHQFGNFTRTSQFGNINPYGGFANNVTIVAIITAIIGVLWLGMSLRSYL